MKPARKGGDNRPHVSMAQIAAQLGLSRATVSHALNDRYVPGVNITEATRAKVKKKAAELGYLRNELAVSIAKGRSRVFGCLGFDPDEEAALYVGAMLSAVIRRATAAGYSVKLLSSRLTVDEAVTACVAYRLDGLLLRVRDEARFREFAARMARWQMPMVLIDSAIADPPGPSVVADNADEARLAVEHLAACGRRRFCFATFETYLPFSRRRLAGFRAAVTAAGGEAEVLDTDDGRPIHPFDRAEDLLAKRLRQPPLPDACFCNGDEIAMLALRAARARGLRVPEDLAVVGCGDLRLAPLATPPLTSVAPPYAAMGALAVELLLRGDGAPREITVPGNRLAIRGSSAPAAR